MDSFISAGRSFKHETTGMTSGGVYFAQDLRLPTDLLRGNPPKTEEVGFLEDYLRKSEKEVGGNS